MGRIIKIEPEERNFFKITFDEFPEITIHYDLILKYNLQNNEIIDENLYNKICYENKLLNAKRIAYNYATYALRTEKQVVDKLTKLGYKSEIIDDVISFLREYNIVDDEKFIEIFIKEKTKFKKWGINKIQSELIKKGIDKKLVAKKLQELYDDEQDLENAIRLIERKIQVLESHPIDKKKQSIINFLMSRGFKWDIIEKVLKKLEIK